MARVPLRALLTCAIVIIGSACSTTRTAPTASQPAQPPDRSITQPEAAATPPSDAPAAADATTAAAPATTPAPGPDPAAATPAPDEPSVTDSRVEPASRGVESTPPAATVAGTDAAAAPAAAAAAAGADPNERTTAEPAASDTATAGTPGAPTPTRPTGQGATTTPPADQAAFPGRPDEQSQPAATPPVAGDRGSAQPQTTGADQGIEAADAGTRAPPPSPATRPQIAAEGTERDGSATVATGERVAGAAAVVAPDGGVSPTGIAAPGDNAASSLPYTRPSDSDAAAESLRRPVVPTPPNRADGADATDAARNELPGADVAIVPGTGPVSDRSQPTATAEPVTDSAATPISPPQESAAAADRVATVEADAQPPRPPQPAQPPPKPSGTRPRPLTGRRLVAAGRAAFAGVTPSTDAESAAITAGRRSLVVLPSGAPLSFVADVSRDGYPDLFLVAVTADTELSITELAQPSRLGSPDFETDFFLIRVAQTAEGLDIDEPIWVGSHNVFVAAQWQPLYGIRSAADNQRPKPTYPIHRAQRDFWPDTGASIVFRFKTVREEAIVWVIIDHAYNIRIEQLISTGSTSYAVEDTDTDGRIDILVMSSGFDPYYGSETQLELRTWSGLTFETTRSLPIVRSLNAFLANVGLLVTRSDWSGVSALVNNLPQPALATIEQTLSALFAPLARFPEDPVPDESAFDYQQTGRSIDSVMFPTVNENPFYIDRSNIFVVPFRVDTEGLEPRFFAAAVGIHANPFNGRAFFLTQVPDDR